MQDTDQCRQPADDRALPRYPRQLLPATTPRRIQRASLLSKSAPGGDQSGDCLANQLKSQQFDPKAKEKIDAEVRDQREAYHQALLDLRKLVDSATEKYDELAKDGEVKKALAAVGKARREKPSSALSRFVEQRQASGEARESGLECDAEQSRRPSRHDGPERTKEQTIVQDRPPEPARLPRKTPIILNEGGVGAHGRSAATLGLERGLSV